MGDVKRISGLRRNAPAVPYRHKKRRNGGGSRGGGGDGEETWDTKRERGSRM